MWRTTQTMVGSQVSLADFRRDLVLELYNEAGQLALAYRIYLPGYPNTRRSPISTRRATVAIERIVLQNEGFERDTAIVEPVEPKTEPDRHLRAGDEAQ